MASYFVARHARADGIHPVHDRTRCPPECFTMQGSEYLGEFQHAAQAVVVARLRYATAGACARCEPRRAAPVTAREPAATYLRS